MGLIFIPSTGIPYSEEGLEKAYWFAVWDRPVPLPHELFAGGTVYLAEQRTGTIVWETTVTDVLAVPYESSLMLREHLTKRWGKMASPINGADPCPGFCVAWKASATERLDLAVPEGLDPLPMWASTHHLGKEDRELWGLRDEGPCPVC